MPSHCQQRRVLITGASGFLGSHLVEKFLSENWHVHTSSRNIAEDPPYRTHAHVADLSQMDQAARLITDTAPDLVVHLAGTVGAQPELMHLLPTFESHVVSAINLMALLGNSHYQRLVLTGSLTEAEAEASVVSSPYAAAKKTVSLYASMLKHLHDLPIVTVRPFMTYGPKQSERKVIPFVINKLLAGERPKLSSGKWRTDWIYVDDVINGMFLAATVANLPSQDIDLGSGTLLTLEHVLSKTADVLSMSDMLDFGAIKDRPDESVRKADIDATRDSLGWSPRISLDEGIERTVKYYSDLHRMAKDV